MNLLPIISNYQDGTRNAKVYKTPMGEFGVIVYDASDDFNGFNCFPTETEAEDFAEEWVLKHEPI